MICPDLDKTSTTVTLTTQRFSRTIGVPDGIGKAPIRRAALRIRLKPKLNIYLIRRIRVTLTLIVDWRTYVSIRYT